MPEPLKDQGGTQEMWWHWTRVGYQYYCPDVAARLSWQKKKAMKRERKRETEGEREGGREGKREDSVIE